MKVLIQVQVKGTEQGRGVVLWFGGGEGSCIGIHQVLF